MATSSSLVITAVVLLATATLGNCDCSTKRLFGNCSFQHICYHDIIGIQLPSYCQGAPINIMITLRNPTAIDDNDPNLDMALIASVTSFRTYGQWPQDNLNIVQRMYALRKLELVGNFIQHIDGSPFYSLHKLEIVDLSNNRLSSVDTLFDVDELQPSRLKRISLANNALENIPGGAFNKMTSLEELDLSHNFISNLNSDSFCNLFMLKQLKLGYNNIDIIPDGVFDNVTSLKELDLSNNTISNLNNYTFSSLRSLEILKLTNNRLVDLDGAINSLLSLEHLYLRGNQLRTIDMQSLQVINHLQTFDISANHLETITSDVLARHWHHVGNHSRCKIILSDNHLVSLPNATSETFIREKRQEEKNNLSKETELDLSKNSITSIEHFAFQYILNLTSLDLSHNKLTDFVVYADDLKHIKYINLSNNYLRDINYESFSAMDFLENLDLSFNYLENVPDPNFISLRSMPRYVNMSANSIVNIDNLRIKFHTKGGVLDLSNNSISVINIPHGETVRLLMLTLRSNKIVDTSLIELSQQNELKYLDMSYNYVKQLNDTSLRLPSSLEHLDMRENEIMYINPSVFKALGRLKILRLSHNQLQRIEYGVFQSLSNLQDLDLSFNDIQFLDSKVFIELKSLQVLSIRYNGMYDLDCKSWIGHKYPVTVNVDGNNFSCQWLAGAISDFNNGISMVRPATTDPVEGDNNVKGIPCVSNAPENLKVGMEGLDADRTLLVMTSKILDAIMEQNRLLQERLMDQSHKMQEAAVLRNNVK